MKVLLVRYLDEIEAPRVPKVLNDLRGVLPNLSILYLAAYVRKFGHEVKIFDAPARMQHLAENPAEHAFFVFSNPLVVICLEKCGMILGN